MAIQKEYTDDTTGVATDHYQLIGMARDRDGGKLNLSYGRFVSAAIPAIMGGQPYNIEMVSVPQGSFEGLEAIMEEIDRAMIAGNPDFEGGVYTPDVNPA